METTGVTLLNNRAGADGGMTVLFHAERACRAAAQHERSLERYRA